jgi:hypothetical protein
MMKRWLVLSAALAVGWIASPSIGEAQGCYDATQCPAGTACVNGACVVQAQVQVQVQGEAVPPPGYGQPQPQQQYPQQQPYPQQQYPQQQQQYPPQQQPYYAQPQPQPQPRTETGHLTGLIVAGAVVLGVSWILNIIVSAFAGAGPSWDDWEAFRYTGLVPAVGPWIQLALIPSGGRSEWDQYLVTDGVIQLAGLTMLILGIAIPVERTVYAQNGGGVQFGFVPNLSPNSAGGSLVGTF